MQYMLCSGAMTGEEAPDKIIREREFKLPSGINIDNLDVPTEVIPVENSGSDSEKKMKPSGTSSIHSLNLVKTHRGRSGKMGV